MFDSYSTASTGNGRISHVIHGDAQVTVFLNRQRFEYGISSLLKSNPGQHAVLHLELCGESGAPLEVGHRILSLAANTLRAGLRAGAVAHLGGSEFAVLLQDTDAWQAAAYARVAADIVNGFRVPVEGTMQPLQACIGGVLTGDCCDGEELLRQAQIAGELAWAKPGRKLHILPAPGPVVTQ